MLCNNFGPKGTLLHLPPGTQLVLGPPNEDLFDPKGTVIGPFFSWAQNNFHFFSLERVDSVTITPCKKQWTWFFSVGRFLLAEARMTLFTPSTPRSVTKNSETNSCIFFMIPLEKRRPPPWYMAVLFELVQPSLELLQQLLPFGHRWFSARDLSLFCGKEMEQKRSEVEDLHCLVHFVLGSCSHQLSAVHLHTDS